MKKLIISVVLSIPFLLTGLPAFSAPPPGVENPIVRTDSSAVNKNISKTTNYAYWHRWHHNHYNRWHRWHHRNHWNRWHHWRHWHRY